VSTRPDTLQIAAGLVVLAEINDNMLTNRL